MVNRNIRYALVSGGTGVTGNALVRYLLSKDIEVTALVREKSPRLDSMPISDDKLKIVEVNLGEYSAKAQYIKGLSPYDVFFHLAWDGSRGKEKVANRNNCELQNSNVGTALDAVELCRMIECPLFVMTGSQAEYGGRDYPINETEEKHPINAYGMAKLCAESMTRLMCKEYGIEHIWSILFSVYGPMDRTESLIDTSLRAIIEGRDIEYSKGLQNWNYLYSFDAAKALLLLAKHGIAGDCYNVAGAVNRPLFEFIRELYEEVCPEREPSIGKRPDLGAIPLPLMADTTKLVEDTGFKEDYTFKDGIKAIYDSLKAERNKL